MNPRVLIGCPTRKRYNYCLDRFLDAVKGLSYDSYDLVMVDCSDDDSYFDKIHKKGVGVIKIRPEDTEEKSMAKARNILRKVCLQTHDYLLMLEQNISPPKDTIQLLMNNGRDIVSGVYFTPVFSGEILPVAYTWLGQEEFREMLGQPEKYGNVILKMKQAGIKNADGLRKQLSFEDVDPTRLMEIKYVGLGCILIKKDVLKKLMFKTDLKGKPASENVAFCDEARALGHKVWLYTGVKCKHILPKEE